MSFCIVGNAEVPPKEKIIVPNASERDKNVGESLTTDAFSDKSVIMSAKMRTTARAVAVVAPTPTGLQRPNGSVSDSSPGVRKIHPLEQQKAAIERKSTREWPGKCEFLFSRTL